MVHELQPFDQSSLSAKQFRITAEWSVDQAELRVVSICKGPVSGLDFDPNHQITPSDNLWTKTCFEVFVLKKNSTEYEEWNFSPSGNHQRYQFSSYRNRIEPYLPPKTSDFSITWSKDTQNLRAQVSLNVPFEIQKVQVCWVIKPLKGETSYWALSHPSSKPDFHLFD